MNIRAALLLFVFLGATSVHGAPVTWRFAGTITDPENSGGHLPLPYADGQAFTIDVTWDPAIFFGGNVLRVRIETGGESREFTNFPSPDLASASFSNFTDGRYSGMIVDTLWAPPSCGNEQVCFVLTEVVRIEIMGSLVGGIEGPPLYSDPPNPNDFQTRTFSYLVIPDYEPDPDEIGGVINSISIVPVPAGAWLLGGALAALAGLKRRALQS